MSVIPRDSLPVIIALTYRSTFVMILQEPDAFNKIQFPDCHHQVYGIEVFFTTEASSQVCLRIYSGAKLFA